MARLMTADVDMVVGNLMRLAPATDILLAALTCFAVFSGARTIATLFCVSRLTL